MYNRQPKNRKEKKSGIIKNMDRFFVMEHFFFVKNGIIKPFCKMFVKHIDRSTGTKKENGVNKKGLLLQRK
jgi:hypothetical protein